MVADTFKRFGEDKIAPQAEHIHRGDLDIPTDIIEGVAELGCFGLSISEAYGGFAQGTEDDYLAMIIATEELSRASLGAGGSLITRPEILARALEGGGTEAQKHHWLPRIARARLWRVLRTSAVFGTVSAKSSITIRPARSPPICRSKKTRGLCRVASAVLAFSANEKSCDALLGASLAIRC